MAASHCCWCMVSLAIMKESISFMPGSFVMLYRRTARTLPLVSAVTFAIMSAAKLPLT
jgi:hypothetical protein